MYPQLSALAIQALINPLLFVLLSVKHTYNHLPLFASFYRLSTRTGRLVLVSNQDLRVDVESAVVKLIDDHLLLRL